MISCGGDHFLFPVYHTNEDRIAEFPEFPSLDIADLDRYR